MTISDLIGKLLGLMSEHGDIDVQALTDDGDVRYDVTGVEAYSYGFSGGKRKVELKLSAASRYDY